MPLELRPWTSAGAAHPFSGSRTGFGFSRPWGPNPIVILQGRHLQLQLNLKRSAFLHAHPCSMGGFQTPAPFPVSLVKGGAPSTPAPLPPASPRVREPARRAERRPRPRPRAERRRVAPRRGAPGAAGAAGDARAHRRAGLGSGGPEGSLQKA